ncbi:hypothetical protein BLNAU_15560 [Blattamonas nauphoetae]|uniref:Uncharacterized protein n=1 Tax=Blattamonas nauphoetae TaxID=2049346 RepID=A0ABQ9XDU4_9EUKA|nr:hypothetical protein BLNAU_15560 [Blattamonas nauphoetae]
MSDLAFDCGWEGICVSKISSSTLTLTSSAIVSNPETSPFVLCAASGRDETSICLVNSSHNSSSPTTLLPLGMFCLLSPPHSDHSYRGSTHSLHSIRSFSLSLSNCTLLRGTGPLLDFSSLPNDSGDVSMTEIGVETSLVAGNFRNVSSLSSQTVFPSSLFSQKIIGTSVTRSTNHLTGTTSLDMNDGGYILCLNSSFAHCDSSLEPSDGPNSSLQHLSSSDTQFYFNSSTTASEIIFTRCTFLSMKPSPFGSAIYHGNAPSSLSISECSFTHIRTTSDYGGAVSFFHSISTKYPFTLTSSSFVNCSASDYGGSLYVYTGRASGADGGAISIHTVTSIVLSNSVFQHCSAGSSGNGGGLQIYSSTRLSMDSLQFRECRGRNGNDVSSNGWTPSQLMSNVTNCDSTSGGPTWFFSKSSQYDDSLIPQTTTTRTLQSIQTSLEADGVSVTLLATVSDAVEGTMLVLVDNTNFQNQTTNNSVPAIQRLLSFAFPSLSTTSSLTVTCGDWELLQLGQAYSVTGSSINRTNLFSNYLTFDTLFTAPLVGVVCRNGTGLDHAWLGLDGRRLVAGSYVCEIVGIDDFVLSVSFNGSTEAGTQNMFSTEEKISLFEEGSKFLFNTQYEVNLVTMEGLSEPIMLDPSRLFFTTPNPPRLTNVGEVRFIDHSKCTIEVDLVCVELPASTYTLSVSSASGTEISLPVEWSTSSKGKATAVVYSLTGSEVDLKFGETYTIVSLSNTKGIDAIFLTPLTFTTPEEPPRVEAVSHFSLTNDKTQVEFKMTGIDFFTQNFVVVLTRNGNEIESSLPIGFVSETEMTIAFPAGLVESSTTLEYGATYTLKSVSNATDSFAVNPSLFIVIPTPPIVSSISSSLSANCTHFQLLLTGTDLPSSGTFVASLSNGETFDVTFTGQEGTSKWFEGNATSSLYFNTSYTINTLISGEEHIVLERRLFRTPEGPTLKGIEATLGSNPDFVDLTLDVERIGTGEWTLVVVEQGKTTEFLFPVTLLSSSEGRTSVPVYKTEGSLEYSKRYEVKRLILGTLTASIPSLVTFTTPPEPARIESVSAVQNIHGTHLVVTLRGRALPSGSYSMSFSELPSETFTGTLKAVGIVGFEISLNHHTAPHLDYHKTYTLQTLTCIGDAIHLNSGLQFDVLGKGYVVIASESGSDDISTCGTVQKPCSSISFGWERAISDAEVEEAIVRIDKQSRFGDRLEVGKKSLVIGGMWGMKGEIVVEEGISTPKGKEGLLMVSGGEVILSELSFSLHSFAHTLTSTHPLFVIGGWGTYSIEQVTIRGMDGAQIGMSLCGLISGHVSLSDVCMKDCSLRDGVSLICGSAPSNKLEMILSDVVVENCTVVNAPLLSFHSIHHSSSFSLVNSQFVSTRLMMSESSQNVKSLVDISTSQTKTEIVGCVFVDCGSVHQNSVLFGNALLIDIDSSSSDLASSRWDVSLASCLFVNNSGVESGDSSGGVWINCGDRLCRISFAESWFEEGLSSTALVRNAQGRVVLLEQSKKKRVVHGGSASRAAVVVERGRLVPQIVRTSSVFSNCRLVVRPSRIS